MKITSAALLSLILLTSSVCAEMRVFTDDQGRTMTAELLETGEGWIKIKRKDGNKFVLTLDKLSAADKAWVEEQAKKRETDVLAKKRAVEMQAKILAYCKDQSGKQVGNGECWTLADEAFNACGLRRPGGDLRVWGRKLDTNEKPQPGDIVEFRSAKFPDGMTGPEHTAIVTGLAKKGRIVIAEQNWSGVKKVHEREMDPAAIQSGEMMFYRPE